MLDYSVFKNYFPPDKIYTNLTVENKFTIKMNKKVQNSEIRCELFIAKEKDGYIILEEEENCKCLIINTIDYIEIKYLLQKKGKYKLRLMEVIDSSNMCRIIFEYSVECTHDFKGDKLEFLPEDYNSDIKGQNKVLSKLERNGIQDWNLIK